MTKHEGNPKAECRNALSCAVAGFVIRVSSFFRISSFVIRVLHSALAENLVDPVLKEKSGIAQTGLLFPKSASDIGKNFAALNFARACPSWRARIRIHGRAVSDNQQRSVRSEFHEFNFTTEYAEATEHEF